MFALMRCTNPSLLYRCMSWIWAPLYRVAPDRRGRTIAFL